MVNKTSCCLALQARPSNSHRVCAAGTTAVAATVTAGDAGATVTAGDAGDGDRGASGVVTFHRRAKIRHRMMLTDKILPQERWDNGRIFIQN